MGFCGLSSSSPSSCCWRCNMGGRTASASCWERLGLAIQRLNRRQHLLETDMKFLSTIRVMGIALAGLFVLLMPLPAFSQNCALCYTQASSAGARMIEALRSGILVMVIPPTLGSIGMIFIVRRRNNRFKREESAAEDW